MIKLNKDKGELIGGFLLFVITIILLFSGVSGFAELIKNQTDEVTTFYALALLAIAREVVNLIQLSFYLMGLRRKQDDN